MTANILGKVFLVGAGPGDPGLLTLKGKRCLEAADVIFYDQLVDGELLEFAHAEAELIYVGKKAGAHCTDQREIESLLIRKAREGRIVVRLKGGDPFIFGRGGEEAEALSAAGIPYEIVPGVSSAIAAPAYAGIPVTHRSCASSVAIVTGHKASSGGSEVKWRELARSVDTIVILMGLQNLRQIMRQLLKGDCEPGRPVAVIQSGTRPSQRTLVATVATIADLVEGAGFKSPTLIVVGKVVDFRRCLQWRESIIRENTLVAGCEAIEAIPWTHCV
ncbi:MAG TPA: uroporphyrinogen-III C-methyltransferase [Candidatus Binatia bacterium]|nr:uroporphyrinogen-III C-methyltransferase [Candidatus Binatia bacterium]